VKDKVAFHKQGNTNQPRKTVKCGKKKEKDPDASFS
jgi:hypothetical protein